MPAPVETQFKGTVLRDFRPSVLVENLVAVSPYLAIYLCLSMVAMAVSQKIRKKQFSK
jgi:hypothetical protein